MNLIEQLGGYQKAKVMLRGLGNEHESLLLQYRRENNIFEEGDLVVNDAFINSYVYVFLKLMPDIGMAMIAYDEDEGACSLHSLRHATDKEIAQGYRDE